VAVCLHPPILSQFRLPVQVSAIVDLQSREKPVERQLGAGETLSGEGVMQGGGGRDKGAKKKPIEVRLPKTSPKSIVSHRLGRGTPALHSTLAHY
jgi:hypothetical protein